MLEKLKKSKTSLFVLLILIIILVAYWIISRDQEIAPQTPSAGQELVGQELLNELERFRNLNRLNVNFFNEPVWNSLRDTKVEVVPQPLGRPNPFISP